MRMKFKCEFEAEVYQTAQEVKNIIRELEDSGVSNVTPFTYNNYPGKGEDYLSPGYHRFDVLSYLVVGPMNIVEARVLPEEKNEDSSS